MRLNFARVILAAVMLFSVAAIAAPPTNIVVIPDFSLIVEQENPVVVTIRVTFKPAPAPKVELVVPGVPGTPQVPSPGAPGVTPPSPKDAPPAPFSKPNPNMPNGGSGSGFIIKPDGYIITNAHVVHNADDITVKLLNGKSYKAKVVGIDVPTDVAVIKIDVKDLPTARIGDVTKVKPGQWVIAIGAPFGFENTVSTGVISAKGRSLPDSSYVQFFQMDVPVNPGNSGGPLFNLNGEVIGINSQIYSRTGGFEGLSFAIPIDIAMNIATQLQANGKIQRGRIGLQVQEISEEMAKTFGMPEPRGALVVAISKDGPAEKAGLKVGDIVLVFDDKMITSSRDLPMIVANTKPGHESTVTVQRNGSLQVLRITVGEFKDPS
jgi:serine protease Do